jgi:glyoxylase-like metal-dependent hydrolase (beta-lactamase superfamily II)
VALIIAANNASEWTGPTGNNTYLLPGPPSVLIDAGVGDTAHLDAIAGALKGGPLDLVLITHGHVDHAAGAPALARRWPGVVVRGGGPGTPLEDGETFRAGQTRLLAVHTPGHAPDHHCLLDESTRDVYCGDLARIGGTVVIPASRGGSLREYLASLERIRALQPRRLLPAHGPVVTDPQGLIDEYLAHRAARERQMVEAMKDGCTRVEDFVARIYPRLSPSLRPAAEDTVRAHLVKLRGNGSTIEE